MAKTIDLAAAVSEAGQPPASPAETTRAPAPAATTGRPASRHGKKGVLIYVEPDMARALKRLALERDTTLQALGHAALEALLQEVPR